MGYGTPCEKRVFPLRARLIQALQGRLIQHLARDNRCSLHQDIENSSTFSIVRRNEPSILSGNRHMSILFL